MRASRQSRIVIGLLAALAAFSGTPLFAAPNLCSARCFSFPNGPHCGLSAFGSSLCTDGQDICIESPCPAALANTSLLSGKAEHRRNAAVASCRPVSDRARDQSEARVRVVRVVQVKART